MKTLTESQFAAAQDKLDSELRATKRGTPERDAANARVAKWEAANSLAQKTWQQRQDRAATIAAVATELGLL